MSNLGELELAKENIVPIRNAKKPNVLRAALQLVQDEDFAHQQHMFEEELENYRGKDPLGLWLKYIAWFEKNCKDGRKVNLGKVIQQCLSNLVSETIYHNDERFVGIWLKFASMTSKPLEVYHNMHLKNIGCGIARFYIEWALELEQLGNLKKANEVLQGALRKNAQPLDDIKTAHAQMKLRLGKTPAKLEQNKITEPQLTVTPLKSAHKNTVRSDSRAVLGNQENNVHEKRSSHPSNFNAQSSEMKANYPIWNSENKLTPVRERVEEHKFLPIHCDRLPSTASNIKADGEILWDDSSEFSLARFEPFNPMLHPMYDKCKVYSGMEEFSFEEIRAVKFWKDKKQMEDKDCQEDKKIIKELTQQAYVMQHKIEQLELQVMELTVQHQKVELSVSKQAVFDPNPVPIAEYSEIRELYNGTFSCPSRHNSQSDSLNRPYDPIGLEHTAALLQENAKLNCPQPFALYFDPTDVIPTKVSISSQERFDGQSMKENIPCHAVSPSQEDDYQLNEDGENMPPSDYIQIAENRELTGILQPSKNVFFKPLEEQSDDENGDYEDDKEEECLAMPLPVDVEDFTVGMNTAKFAAAVIASTPCIKNPTFKVITSPIISTEEYPIACMGVADQLSGITETSPKFKSPLPCPQEVMEHQASLALHSWKLNTIAEVSQEGSSAYSKSSSSNCSSGRAYKSGMGLCQTGSSLSASKNSAFSILQFIAEESTPSVKTFDLKAVHQKSFHLSDVNPFDIETTSRFLRSLPTPLSDTENFYICNSRISQMKQGKVVTLGEFTYLISNLHGSGAYAKVYEAHEAKSMDDQDEPLQVAVKVCCNANEWEFYVCSSLRQRLALFKSPDVSGSIMNIRNGAKFENGLMLVSELKPVGTLLDLVNSYKTRSMKVPECIAMYLTYEILQIVIQMHKCGFVHADIKPDNFLLNRTPTVSDLDTMEDKTSCLCLIDFGRSIDLSFYNPGVCFNTVVETDGFKCVEMQENRPWVFQPDWYGVLGCIHIILFSEYLKVRKNKEGLWELLSKFKRFWKVDFWQALFTTLLNIKQCYVEPDLEGVLATIRENLRSQPQSFRTAVNKMPHFVS